MRIIYDSVSAEYTYPLSKADVGRVKNHVPSDIWDTILYIRFGFSANSTHAGRMFGRGNSYRIRVNFCLKKVEGRLQSPLVCRQKRYVENVRRYGGKPDLITRTIAWDLKSAKRYALYVLLHEIGHVVYAEKDLPGSRSFCRISREEDWCDEYSVKLMQEMGMVH